MMNGKTMTIAMAQMARMTIIAARALFCFAHIRRIHGRSYAIFAFNGEERPVF